MDTWLPRLIGQECMIGVSLPSASNVIRPSCRPRPNFDDDHIDIYLYILVFTYLVVDQYAAILKRLTLRLKDLSKQNMLETITHPHAEVHVGCV